MLDFLGAQDQYTQFIPPESIIEVEGNNVYVLDTDGSRRETINYPELIDLYVSQVTVMEIP